MINEEIIEQQSFLDKYINFKNNLFKNKIFRILAFLFFLFIAVLFFIPVLIDNDSLKDQLQKTLKQALNNDVAIKGKVYLELIPNARIVAQDILILNAKTEGSNQNYNVFAKEAKFKIRIFNKNNKNPLKQISLSDVIIEKHSLSNNETDNRGNDIKNILNNLRKRYPQSNAKKVKKTASGIQLDIYQEKSKQEPSAIFKTLPRIAIYDSKFITYDKYKNKKEYDSLNAKLVFNNKEILADGYFVVEDIISSFDAKLVFDERLRKKPNSYLEIKSPSLNFRFDGNLASKEKNLTQYDIGGSIIAEIKDFKKFYLSYVGSKNTFSKKLKANSPAIKISAKIASNNDGSFIDDLTIKSPIINGQGSMAIFKTAKVPILDIALKIKDIDIDSFWSSDPAKIDQQQLTQEEEPELFGIDNIETILSVQEPQILQKDFDLTAEIDSKLVFYKNTQITDFNLYFNSYAQGEIIINPLSFNFPGQGKFHANGKLDSEESTPRFIGKVSISGKDLNNLVNNGVAKRQRINLDYISDYKIYTNLDLRPSEVKFDNFFANLNQNKTEISGNIDLKIIDKTPQIIGDLNISNFDIEDQIKNFNLKKYAFRGALIEKLFWLNDLSSKTNLKLKIDRINYLNEEFFSNSLNFEVSRGKIAISNLILDPNNHNSQASFLIDIGQSVPKFEIALKAKNFTLFSDIKEESIPQFKLKDGTSSVDEEETINRLFLPQTYDQFFQITSLNGFSGFMKFNFDNLRFKNNDLKKFNFDSKLNNGVLDEVTITTKNNDIDFKYDGNIGLKRVKTIAGTLSINNINYPKLVEKIIDKNNISTTINLSTSLSSFGKNNTEFIKNLDGDLKFSAIAPNVKEYGLNDLIKKMFLPKKYFSLLKEPDKILHNKEQQTIFKNAAGAVRFKNNQANLNVKVQGLLSNSVLSGSINLLNKETNLAFSTIFMTGSRQKLKPITIATNISGVINDLNYKSNYDQILQYLGLKKVEKKPQNDEAPNKQNDPESIQSRHNNKANSVLKNQGFNIPKNASPSYINQIQPVE